MQDNNSNRNTTDINTDGDRPLAMKELSIEDLRGVRGATMEDDAAGDCGCEKCKCKGESADAVE
jgi:hypothetical protein